MRTSTGPRADRSAAGGHPVDVVATQHRVLGPLAAHRSSIAVRSGRRLHVVQTGEGPPALFLHGTNTSSVSFAPVLGRLRGVGALALDRPGHGLSDDAPVSRARFRPAAIELMDDVLDALALDSVAVVGQSGGGVWALWYAMARPERVRSLVLLGSVPLLPGTRCPPPQRAMATPLLGPMLAHVVAPTPRSLVRLMSSIGEGDTIVRYPELIDALIAGGRDPVAVRADLAEMRALVGPLGFRRALRFREAELEEVEAPTLLIWGDHDPVGSVDVARTVARLLPRSRLEVLPTGHVPQLGCPDRVAALLSTFLGSGRDVGPGCGS